MTNEEFKTTRNQLGYTVAKLADILDVDPRTVRKWEANPDLSTSRPPNPIACRVLNWLQSGQLKI